MKVRTIWAAAALGALSGCGDYDGGATRVDETPTFAAFDEDDVREPEDQAPGPKEPTCREDPAGDDRDVGVDRDGDPCELHDGGAP